MANERWTDAEVGVIKAMAPEHSAAEIAKAINKRFNVERTSGGVKTRACMNSISLGGRSGEKQHQAKLSDKSVQMVRSLSACGYSLKDIQATLKISMSKAGLHAIIKEEVRETEIPEQAVIVAKYELEIATLKKQYRELQEYKGDLDSLLADMVLTTISRIRTMLGPFDYAFVYWDASTKKFKVLKKDKDEDENLVGVYAKGCDIKILKEDLYAVLNEAYRGV